MEVEDREVEDREVVVMAVAMGVGVMQAAARAAKEADAPRVERAVETGEGRAAEAMMAVTTA